MSKKLVIVFVFSALFFSACTHQNAPATSTQTAPAGQTQTPTKQGDTTKTGKISKIGEKYFLQESGKQPMEIDSYAVDLSGYVGQAVSVTGQYSGDTLFVGSVQ